jgi:hypothetical protein
MSDKKIPHRTVKTKRYLRHQWTADELTQKGGELAQSTREVAQLKEDGKRVASDFKAKIAAKNAAIGELSSDITSGYTMRDVECTVTLNKPKTGKKTIARDDTKEVIGTEDMTADELQEQLNLNDKKAAVRGTPVLTDEQADKVKAGKKEAADAKDE